MKAKRDDKLVVREKKRSPPRVYTFEDYEDVLRDPDESTDEREV